MNQTIYEKYGGFSRINRIVMELYDRILDSDQIGRFFDDTDMAQQINHQTSFVAGIMGGPYNISDTRLERSHDRLDISNSDFDELKSILTSVLDDFGLDAEDRDLVVGEFDKRRHLVVKG